jgi:hypothetical protein
VDDEHEITIDPALEAGVWANWAEVVSGPHEFTIDFARLSPQDRSKGVLVARVSFSAGLLSDLKAAVDEIWAEYAQQAMPKEVSGDGSEQEENDDQGP